jgi:hypothetical protein
LEYGELLTKQSDLNAVTLNLHVLGKLKSNRINNFLTFSLFGFEYSNDLATQQNVLLNELNPIMKVKRHDFAFEIGGGFDFFLEYFKFGMELKLSTGINDLNVYDNSFYNQPITSLTSKVWRLSFTFEG